MTKRKKIITKICWRCCLELPIQMFISSRHHICEKCRTFTMKVKFGKVIVSFD